MVEKDSPESSEAKNPKKIPAYERKRVTKGDQKAKRRYNRYKKANINPKTQKIK